MSSLAQFSLSADQPKGQKPPILWLERLAADGKDDELKTQDTAASQPAWLYLKAKIISGVFALTPDLKE